MQNTEPDSPTPKSAGIAAASAAVPVLDVAQALAHMGNNQALYREFAQGYLQELAHLVGDIHALLLKAADRPLAGRKLHTFKGLSLTMGAQHMAEVCRQCEMRLQRAAEPSVPLQEQTIRELTEALFDACEATRSALQTGLRQLLGAQPTSPTDPGGVDELQKPCQ